MFSAARSAGSGLIPARWFLALVTISALPAFGADTSHAITAYGGFRSGGSFTDVDTDKSLDLGTSGAMSVALDLPYDASRQYQIFFSHQRTDLHLEGTQPAPGGDLEMTVTYLHIGGSNFFSGEVGKGPYLVGGLGATLFDPVAGYDSDLRASINRGLGYQLPLGETLALRFEARGYATLVNSSGGLFCSGGCVASIKGDLITQGELMLGVTGRF